MSLNKVGFATVTVAASLFVPNVATILPVAPGFLAVNLPSLVMVPISPSTDHFTCDAL
ncbi:hypothetical protein D3C79_923340 [compost metagenome]